MIWPKKIRNNCWCFRYQDMSLIIPCFLQVRLSAGIQQKKYLLLPTTIFFNGFKGHQKQNKKTPTWHGSKVTAAVNRRMLDSSTFSVEAFAKAYQAACLCSHKTPWPGHHGAHQPEICTKNKQMKPTELEGKWPELKSPSLRLASTARGELHITYRVEQVELDFKVGVGQDRFSWAVWGKELLIESWVFASDVFLDSETKVAKILWWWSLQLYFWIWKLQ